MTDASTDGVLYDSHPKMFRGHPLGFLVSVVLIPVAGLGILILLVWWLKCKATRLTLDEERSLLERGLLSKSRMDLRHAHVRTVHVYQTLGQRLFGVGRITIYTAGDEPEIEVDGMPDPYRVREIIGDGGA